MTSKTFLVVLSCNGLPTTQKFIEQLYENTDQDEFDLLFIDNGSDDDTPHYLEECSHKYENMHVIFNESNRGVIGGRNQGFGHFVKNSSCDRIMFLDNDQFVKRNWLPQHVSVLNRGYDIVGVEAWQMSNSFLPIKKNSSLKEVFSYVGCGGMIITRNTVDEIGFFDDQFNPSYFEDPDYCFRVHKNKLKIGWNIEAKIVHLPHQTLGGMEDKRERFIRSIQRFRNKWKGHKPPRLYQTWISEFEEVV